jgi:hypothetical protein
MKLLNLLLFFILTGCAADSYVLKKNHLLPYKESSQITKLSQEAPLVELISVDDIRPNQSVGFAFTGVEYKQTPIYLESSISNLVSEYLSSALEVRNIELVKSSKIKMKVEIKKFRVFEVIEKMQPERAKCELELSFKISNGSKNWSGSYLTEFLSGGDMTDATERLAPTMASCLNDLIEKMVNDEKFSNILLGETTNE